jgi:predicted RNase H-like HicB family nuclease
MFAEYIQAALEKAQYKVIDNGDEPYFVDVPELDGVWATGCSVEVARRNFIEALEDWIAAHLLWNLALPPISGQTIGFLWPEGLHFFSPSLSRSSQ